MPFRRTTDRNRSGRCCGWPPDPVVRVGLERDLLVRCEHTRQTLRVRENLFSSQCAAPRQSRRSNRNSLAEIGACAKSVRPRVRRGAGARMSVHAGERRLHIFTTLFPGGLPRMTDHDPPPPGAGQTPRGGPPGGPPPPGWPPPGDAPEYRVGHAAAPGAAGGPAMAGGLGRQPPQPGIPWGRPLHKPGTVPLRPLTLTDFFDGAFTTIRRNPRATIGVAAAGHRRLHGAAGADRDRARPHRSDGRARHHGDSSRSPTPGSPPPTRSLRSSASWPASWSPAWSPRS